MQSTTMIVLLQKYIKNECSDKELRILLHWLKSTDDDSYLDLVAMPLWNQINRATSYPNQQGASELREEASSLLLKIKQGKHKKQRTKRNNKSRKIFLYRIVAVLLLAISATWGLYYFLDTSLAPVSYIEKIANKGERKNIKLPDGTSIIMNSNTKIRIPSDFNKHERIIEMEGEGFFEVAHNPKKPFIIKNKETQVKVLGTSFDFKSYQEDDYIKLTVSTGKVQINIADQDLQISVLPNEHLSINKTDGNISKKIIQENNYIQWTYGSLYFYKEPLPEVIKTINRTYNRNVILECKNCNYKITGTHDNKSIEAVIEAICFTTGLHKRIEDDKIILYK